ncbi:MAG: hypothetical protein LC650_03880 [Actinobacteria bacterium]|nr:hypothetical protein [Actinomycetota bacterium]
MSMTKIQAVSEWRRDILSAIREEENGVPDRAMRYESWNVFTDMLCKEGRITEEQYNDWSAPIECRG